MGRLRLENLHKRFAKTVAVDHISMSVQDGEFLTLLGPSGCGKTTTLRMIAGLENPTEGEIYYGDTLISKTPSRDRNFAMVFERYALYPHLKAFDNIATPLKIRGVAKDEIDRRVRFFADMLQITNRLDHWPSQLSGGERQRIGIARALIREPSLFLLDEPISHLDAKLRIRMRAELKKLHKKMGITTIHVTHDQVEAMTMGDRVALMQSGTIQQIGTPEELFNKPSNLFVAKFIGEPTINALPCRMIEKENQVFLEGEKYEVLISTSFAERLKRKKTEQELLLAFRPQHCILGGNRRKDKELAFPATISLIEPLGIEQIAHLQIGSEEIRWIGSSDLKLKIAENILVRCPENKVLLFDNETEKNVTAGL